MDLTKIFVRRREQLLNQIGDGIALISSDGFSPDKSLFDKNLRYLSGLSTRNAFLMLSADGITADAWETHHGPEVGRGRKYKEILFMHVPSEREVLVDGSGETVSSIQKKTGIEKILPLSKLNPVLESNLPGCKTFWCNLPSLPGLDEPISKYLDLMHKIRERYIWIDFHNLAPLIHEMRRVKDSHEIACLRRAYEIHTEIYCKIMKTLKPGINESIGEAIWHHEILAVYDPLKVNLRSMDLFEKPIIVASGKHTATAHYMDNNTEIKDGDLVLIDTGVDYMGYCSDITRTFPANGKFSDRQRELYVVVLEAQKRAIATMKPGSTALAAHEAIFNTMKEYGLEKYNYGMAGHPVGLNIHDANGVVTRDMDQPFEPGVVLAIEPFISIPEEGIGIRIEDGVLITENGAEKLAGPPSEIDELEAFLTE